MHFPVSDNLSFPRRIQRGNLRISSRGFMMGLFPILAFFFQTEGFDLYHHTTSYYFDYPINRGHTLGEFAIIPRYLLLSDILIFFRMAGLPLGWVILGLCVYPAYQIGASSTFRYLRLKPGGRLIYFAVFTLSLFYSGASLAILWVLAYFFTRKSVFLLGLAFHPVGYLITISMIVLVRSIKFTAQIGIFAALYFGFCYYRTLYNFPVGYIDTPVFANITLQNIVTLLEFTISRKTNELIVFGFLVAIAPLVVRKNRIKSWQTIQSANNDVIATLIYLYSFLLLLFVLTILVIGKNTLFSYLITLQAPLPVYVTWLDFGAPNFSGSFNTLLQMRLK